MIPFGHEEVTLIKRTETVGQDGKTHAVYTNHTLNGCSWRRITHMTGTGENRISESITVRIPYGQIKPCAGDLMIKGEYTDTVTSDGEYDAIIRARRADGGAFVVTDVSDNGGTECPIPHMKAAGWF